MGSDDSPTASLHCENCGDEIPSTDEAVWGSGGVKESGLEKMSDGETIGADELFGFDDGPYCSLGCSVNGGDDG